MTSFVNATCDGRQMDSSDKLYKKTTLQLHRIPWEIILDIVQHASKSQPGQTIHW